MGLVSNVNRVLNAKSTGIFLFGFTGACKVLTDYQRAPKSEKKNVLLRDSTILAGSALGLAAYSSGRKTFVSSAFRKNSSKFIDNSFEKLKKTKLWKNFSHSIGKRLKNPAEIVIKNSYNVLKDCLDNTSMVASGIIGAVGTDYLMQISHTHKKIVDNKIKTNIPELENSSKENNTYIDPFSKLKNKLKENDFGNIVNENTKKNIISNITNMPEMKIFNSTMVGLQSFEVTEEKTFKDKLRHTTKSLLTNTLVPMFFLSLASNVTKNVKSIYRVPIVFTTMVLGTMAANKRLEKQMNKINSEQ